MHYSFSKFCVVMGLACMASTAFAQEKTPFDQWASALAKGFSYKAEAAVNFPAESRSVMVSPAEDPKLMIEKFTVDYRTSGGKFFCLVNRWNGHGAPQPPMQCGYDGSSYYCLYQQDVLNLSSRKKVADEKFTWMIGIEELVTLPFCIAGSFISDKTGVPSHRSQNDVIKGLSLLRGAQENKQPAFDLVQAGNKWSFQMDPSTLYPKRTELKTANGRGLTLEVLESQSEGTALLPKKMKFEYTIDSKVIKEVVFTISEYHLGSVEIPSMPAGKAKEVFDFDLK